MKASLALMLLLIGAPVNAGDWGWGAGITATGGIYATVTGSLFYNGAGWIRCEDRSEPKIKNEKTSAFWITRVICSDVPVTEPWPHPDSIGNLGTPCDREPAYKMQWRGDLWQIYIYCPDEGVPVS